MHFAQLPTRTTFGRTIALRDFGGFALSLGVHAPHEDIPAHQHADEFQWCLVLSGGFEESAGRQSQFCGAGSFVVRPPDCVHADRFTASRGVCLNVFPKADWLSSQALGRLANCYAHERTRRLQRLGEELARELEEIDEAAEVTVHSVVHELLSSVARLKESTEAGRPHWLGAALDRIEAELAADLSLDSLAQDAGVSAGHLARAFRSSFGCSVGAYVRERRLKRAVALMRETKCDLAEIATAVGFHDQAHFSHAFKRRYGAPPNTFRRAL